MTFPLTERVSPALICVSPDSLAGVVSRGPSCSGTSPPLCKQSWVGYRGRTRDQRAEQCRLETETRPRRALATLEKDRGKVPGYLKNVPLH